MWLEPEEILAGLGSGDQERVHGALRALREASDGLDEFPVPYPGLRPIESIAAPNAALQLDLLRVLSEYGSFEPAPGQEQIAADLVALTLRTGDDRVALETSFLLKRDPALLAGVITALEREVQDKGVGMGALRLTSYLLAGTPPVRAATVAALRCPALAPLRERIRPELEPDELA